jgi:type II secretory pathway component GspD/PulD (secretin)
MCHTAIRDVQNFIKITKESTDTPICIDSEGVQHVVVDTEKSTPQESLQELLAKLGTIRINIF